ncbi:hypothetical protein L1987_27784 [Smallanthus sonchifolius]|uniref:Uncharacterized protein n=1 Tax=Smallanthus sonchifolius TaxID=185202 RepID=A0ACB9ID57_9ASTR|nr:hypothetical protein L1987_27784 [Smallanthus sonchifolius]
MTSMSEVAKATNGGEGHGGDYDFRTVISPKDDEVEKPNAREEECALVEVMVEECADDEGALLMLGKKSWLMKGPLLKLGRSHG